MTFSSFAVTVGLVLWRPSVGARFRLNPAAAAGLGVLAMMALGSVGMGDINRSAVTLWRPFVAISSIMVMTAAAQYLGVLGRLARALPQARSAERLFTGVFVLSAATSAILNNDAAVLLLTPVVVALVRRIYPDQDDLLLPFAFAVFMAAGVAPLVVSNPMNMIVAEYAGIDFNGYAVRMLPVSLVGWVLTFVVLKRLFIARLRAAPEPVGDTETKGAWTTAQKQVIALTLSVVAAYPIASYAGSPVWIVAVVGAATALVIVARHAAGAGVGQALRGVSWETLGFLLGIFILALGLRNVGIVSWLTELYEGVSLGMVGGVSALGSAVMNNHPMALINMLAIEGGGGGQDRLLAALIGGDLGPRLLPMGSLAGLLWLASLRRVGVEVPLRTFVTVGAAVTLPTLAAGLLLLSLYS